MRAEFLDFVDDILDAMEKAKILLTNVTYDQFASDFRIHYAVARGGMRALLQRKVTG